jgi:hypothetical protein
MQQAARAKCKRGRGASRAQLGAQTWKRGTAPPPTPARLRKGQVFQLGQGG